MASDVEHCVLVSTSPSNLFEVQQNNKRMCFSHAGKYCQQLRQHKSGVVRYARACAEWELADIYVQRVGPAVRLQVVRVTPQA